MRKREIVLEKVTACVVLFVGLLLLATCARADVVSEFGMGYKMPYTTSVVMLPQCHVVVPLGVDGSPVLGRKSASCGGDNPAFVGWPIAWEKDFDGPLSIRAGWFHYSNWFDGGRGRETHMDLAAVTLTVNWSEWLTRRRQKR